MNVLEKTKILGEAGQYDSCGPKACEVKVDSGLGGIYHAKAEHKTCRLFKTLMNNECSFDCKYCGNSNKCAKKKASYKPKELASVFNHLHKKLDVEGMFLSSSVAGNPDKVTEDMIETVKILRFNYKFRGYIHFKVLPGTSYELIKQASELSTRMSINIEAPNKSTLSELSSCKDYKIDILRRQAWISKFKLGGGQTTQLIVNNLSTDKDILKMVDWEYDKLNLRRIYFSAFRPVKGTALENEKPESPLRQNHLYNVDFLMRKYGYKLKEFDSVMEDEMLPNEDPKLALAKATFDGAVDINEAPYEELIRVPGIGPKTAKNIIKSKKITKYEQLHKLGGCVKRAKPFIQIDGKRQTMLRDF
ncbi:helix-hairpin-helix domain-containing protein [Candidatus Woesearchaeota archaeon]|nr:helix-hairpin-helix domain-containing protein [Candidatus Woesearchaeota archaeon]